MHVLIVSGRSGSGKSISLHALEDLGYYCVDNIPVEMIVNLVEKLKTEHPLLAISIDARNLPTDINRLKEMLAQLKASGQSCDILYLDAKDESLLSRFSETRRRHPLCTDSMSLREAIQQERLLLAPVSEMADMIIDSSDLSTPQLSAFIREQVAPTGLGGIKILLESFGYKRGIPTDADFIFDVRCLPNPYWQPGLRAYTGLDKEVTHYLSSEPRVNTMVSSIAHFLDQWIPEFERDNRSYLTIAIGCTGGQHRSVFVAEALLQILKASHPQVIIRHRELA
jgi:UPF0042 nucleotide-binding protein